MDHLVNFLDINNHSISQYLIDSITHREVSFICGEGWTVKLLP